MSKFHDIVHLVLVNSIIVKNLPDLSLIKGCLNLGIMFNIELEKKLHSNLQCKQLTEDEVYLNKVAKMYQASGTEIGCWMNEHYVRWEEAEANFPLFLPIPSLTTCQKAPTQLFDLHPVGVSGHESVQN